MSGIFAGFHAVSSCLPNILRTRHTNNMNVSMCSQVSSGEILAQTGTGRVIQHCACYVMLVFGILKMCYIKIG